MAKKKIQKSVPHKPTKREKGKGEERKEKKKQGGGDREGYFSKK